MSIELTEEERKETTFEKKKIEKKAKENDCKQVAIPRLNFAISSYYKGTGLEEVLKKLEEYLDHADGKESDITNI